MGKFIHQKRINVLMEKELIHEVENKLVEIVGRSNVYVKASPIPEFDWMLYIRGYEFLCEVKKSTPTPEYACPDHSRAGSNRKRLPTKRTTV